MTFAPPFQRPFSATFDRRAAAAAAAGNGLLNALIAYWPGNEASGDLLDLHSNGLHLTDINTVTDAAGKVYATARSHDRSQLEYFTRSSQAELQTGDVDFTIAAWVYVNISTQGGILSKDAAANNREYGLAIDLSVVLQFGVSADGVSGVRVTASTFGTVSTGDWVFAVAWHDSVSNTISMQINNGAVDSAAHAGGVYAGVSDFRIGRGLSNETSRNAFFGGRIGPVAFWKSAAGGGGVLTTAQRTALYNAGNGLAYAQFTT